jgi:prepilin-type N-terminal cleavage/methylation domain-containing protein
MTPASDQRGFTALEMLVAVAILFVVMSAVAGLLQQGIRINKSQQMRVTAQSNARTCLSMIERKLRTAGWDPMSAGLQSVQLDTDPYDGIDEITLFADLDADGNTDGLDEQVVIRHVAERIEWRRSANGSFEVLAIGITNDSDGDGNTEQMFVADSTTDPTRIVVQITAESPASDPMSREPIRYTLASEIVLRNKL